MRQDRWRKVNALGRLKSGQMNGTERAYEQTLNLRVKSGEVLWYKFEGIRFVLGKRCTYTPDFAVMLPDGTMEIHEVKGFWRDDARVKIKIAAELFPFRFIAITKKKGKWEVEEF